MKTIALGSDRAAKIMAVRASVAASPPSTPIGPTRMWSRDASRPASRNAADRLAIDAGRANAPWQPATHCAVGDSKPIFTSDSKADFIRFHRRRVAHVSARLGLRHRRRTGAFGAAPSISVPRISSRASSKAGVNWDGDRRSYRRARHPQANRAHGAFVSRPGDAFDEF